MNEQLLRVPRHDIELWKNYRRTKIVFSKILALEFENWFVMFSGGKDSTLLTILALDYLRTHSKAFHLSIAYTDSLMEIPQAKTVALTTLSHVEKVVQKEGLPVTVHRLKPAVSDTYWVSIIGRGYTPPRAHFRWCTPRLKIFPSAKILRYDRSERKAVLTGVRYDESRARKRNLTRSCANGGECGQDFWIRHGPKSGGVTYFAPVIFWRTCKVWDFLTIVAPGQGWPTGALRDLYGGESLRFGCWSCTLVRRDRSTESLILRGNGEILSKLNNLRSYVDDASRDSLNRRVNGEGKLRGFTLSFCRDLLDRLLILQRETNLDLVSREEIMEIGRIWKIREKQE